MHITTIGGGAAGIMATAAAIETDPDVEVTIVERNPRLGRKVALSGGGRSNVTTGLRDIKEILARYPRGGKFLSSALRRFPPESVMAWFEAHDVPLKTESDLRVFPRSDKGEDVVAAFERLFRTNDSRIDMMLGRQAIGVSKHGDKFMTRLKTGETIESDRLILTTGGQAYRNTGSTGDGYAFAESLGHTITALAPSLSSFTIAETWPKDLSGLSLPWARLSFVGGESVNMKGRPSESPTLHYPLSTLHSPSPTLHETTGPFIFTHHGISGPAVFALSSLLAFKTFDKTHPFPISIDLFPEEKAESLSKRLIDTMHENGKKSLKTVVSFLVPKAIASIIVEVSGLDGEKQVAQMTKQDVSICVQALKSLTLHLIGRGAGEEFVTAGGVNTDEVDQRTMESKIVPGLYFAGEILDIDGFTGGFNLQAAWATGRAAGEAAAS